MSQIKRKHAPSVPSNAAKRRMEMPQEAFVKFVPATEAELKEIGDDLPDGFIAGWASTPDLDSWGDVIVTGAFDAAISRRGLKGPKGVKLLIGHDWDKVGGLITKLETRGARLWIEAQINLKISYARDAYEAALMAGGLSFSVGFFPQDYGWKEDKSGNEYFEITRGDLFEVSVVPFPGNEECTMEIIKARLKSARKDMSIKTAAEFEKFLVSKGLVMNRNDAQAITQVVKTCAHLFGAPPDDDLETSPGETKQPLLAEETKKRFSSAVDRILKTVG